MQAKIQTTIASIQRLITKTLPSAIRNAQKVNREAFQAKQKQIRSEIAQLDMEINQLEQGLKSAQQNLEAAQADDHKIQQEIESLQKSIEKANDVLGAANIERADTAPFTTLYERLAPSSINKEGAQIAENLAKADQKVQKAEAKLHSLQNLQILTLAKQQQIKRKLTEARELAKTNPAKGIQLKEERAALWLKLIEIAEHTEEDVPSMAEGGEFARKDAHYKYLLELLNNSQRQLESIATKYSSSAEATDSDDEFSDEDSSAEDHPAKNSLVVLAQKVKLLAKTENPDANLQARIATDIVGLSKKVAKLQSHVASLNNESSLSAEVAKVDEAAVQLGPLVPTPASLVNPAETKAFEEITKPNEALTEIREGSQELRGEVAQLKAPKRDDAVSILPEVPVGNTIQLDDQAIPAAAAVIPRTAPFALNQSANANEVNEEEIVPQARIDEKNNVVLKSQTQAEKQLAICRENLFWDDPADSDYKKAFADLKKLKVLNAANPNVASRSKIEAEGEELTQQIISKITERLAVCRTKQEELAGKAELDSDKYAEILTELKALEALNKDNPDLQSQKTIGDEITALKFKNMLNAQLQLCRVDQKQLETKAERTDTEYAKVFAELKKLAALNDNNPDPASQKAIKTEIETREKEIIAARDAFFQEAIAEPNKLLTALKYLDLTPFDNQPDEASYKTALTTLENIKTKYLGILQEDKVPDPVQMPLVEQARKDTAALLAYLQRRLHAERDPNSVKAQKLKKYITVLEAAQYAYGRTLDRIAEDQTAVTTLYYCDNKFDAAKAKAVLEGYIAGLTAADQAGLKKEYERLLKELEETLKAVETEEVNKFQLAQKLFALHEKIIELCAKTSEPTVILALQAYARKIEQVHPAIADEMLTKLDRLTHHKSNLIVGAAQQFTFEERHQALKDMDARVVNELKEHGFGSCKQTKDGIEVKTTKKKPDLSPVLDMFALKGYTVWFKCIDADDNPISNPTDKVQAQLINFWVKAINLGLDVDERNTQGGRTSDPDLIKLKKIYHVEDSDTGKLIKDVSKIAQQLWANDEKELFSFLLKKLSSENIARLTTDLIAKLATQKAKLKQIPEFTAAGISDPKHDAAKQDVKNTQAMLDELYKKTAPSFWSSRIPKGGVAYFRGLNEAAKVNPEQVGEMYSNLDAAEKAGFWPRLQKMELKDKLYIAAAMYTRSDFPQRDKKAVLESFSADSRDKEKFLVACCMLMKSDAQVSDAQVNANRLILIANNTTKEPPSYQRSVIAHVYASLPAEQRRDFLTACSKDPANKIEILTKAFYYATDKSKFVKEISNPPKDSTFSKDAADKVSAAADKDIGLLARELKINELHVTENSSASVKTQLQDKLTFLSAISPQQQATLLKDCWVNAGESSEQKIPKFVAIYEAVVDKPNVAKHLNLSKDQKIELFKALLKENTNKHFEIAVNLFAGELRVLEKCKKLIEAAYQELSSEKKEFAGLISYLQACAPASVAPKPNGVQTWMLDGAGQYRVMVDNLNKTKPQPDEAKDLAAASEPYEDDGLIPTSASESDEDEELIPAAASESDEDEELIPAAASEPDEDDGLIPAALESEEDDGLTPARPAV